MAYSCEQGRLNFFSIFYGMPKNFTGLNGWKIPFYKSFNGYDNVYFIFGRKKIYLCLICLFIFLVNFDLITYLPQKQDK
jgi:hypothetical protein